MNSKFFLQREPVTDPRITSNSYTRRYARCFTKTAPCSRYDVIRCRPLFSMSTNTEQFRWGWHRPRWDDAGCSPRSWNSTTGYPVPDVTMTNAEPAPKWRRLQRSTHPTNVYKERTDRYFHDSAPSTFHAGWGCVPDGPSTAQFFWRLLHACQFLVACLSSQQLSYSSVSVATHLQAIHISLSHRAHVFLKKWRFALHSWPVMASRISAAYEKPRYVHCKSVQEEWSATAPTCRVGLVQRFLPNTQHRRRGTRFLSQTA